MRRLSFWIIFLGLTVFESVSDVLLSWIPTYYEIKLVFIVWLGLFNGADHLYRNVHDIFVYSRRKMVKLGLIRKVMTLYTQLAWTSLSIHPGPLTGNPKP